MSNQIHTYQHELSLRITLRTSHIASKPANNMCLELHDIITQWIQDKYKWEVFFDPQSQSPDINQLLPVFDKVSIDDVQVVRVTENGWVHHDNEEFVDFINTDAFYKQDI